jgi:flavin-dependent dehydrogenase
VDKVTASTEAVTVEGSGRTFKARYVIAADGSNSRTAESAGFNRDRLYYCNMYSIAWDMSGMQLPEPDIVYTIQGFHKGCGVMLFALPEAARDRWMLIMVTVDPRANLNEAAEAFMKKPFCASWFRDARKLNARSAVCNCWSPIIEPFRNNVIAVGDAASTQELENTAAMISGWKSGLAAAASIQEERLGLEVTGIRNYAQWWKQIYTPMKSEIYMKIYAPPYFLTSDEDMDLVLGSVKGPLKPCWNPYTSPLGEALKKVIPEIERQHPEMAPKLARRKLPAAQTFAEITRISKPVS